MQRPPRLLLSSSRSTIEGSPLPQLAQVAQQQAQYLAPVVAGEKGESDKPFHFFSLGSMASLGDGKAIYDGSHVGDPHGFGGMLPNLRGFAAWLAWRSAYWGKQVRAIIEERKSSSK